MFEIDQFSEEKRETKKYFPEKLITFGTGLRYVDQSYVKFRNDIINGISPSIKYGVKRNGGHDNVSITALSRLPTLSLKLRQVAKGNDYYDHYLFKEDRVPDDGMIPFAYILDIKEIAAAPNTLKVQQNWGYGKPGPLYWGLGNYVSTPGEGNYWEGELRVHFQDPVNSKCIPISTVKCILIREGDRELVQSWAKMIRDEGQTIPHIPIFSQTAKKFLGIL